jgi:hypothetical protein
MRLIALEQSVQTFRDSAHRGDHANPGAEYSIVIIGVLACLLTIGYYYVSFVEPEAAFKVDIVALLLPPLLFGLLLGVVSSGGNPRHWFGAGLLLGVVNLNALWFLLVDSGLRFGWPWALSVFLVCQPFVVFTGTLVSRVVARRLSWGPTSGRTLNEFEATLERIARNSENAKVVYSLALQVVADLALVVGHYLLRAGQ